MKIFQLTIGSGVLSIALTLSGCHCFSISERYGDHIDRVADSQMCLDHCYRPGLDLTRLGRRRIHQEAFYYNTGVYPQNHWPDNAAEQSDIPPAPATEEVAPTPIENEGGAAPPPPPAPPVPAAALPVLDISHLNDLSTWKPAGQFQPASEPKPLLVESDSQSETSEIEQVDSQEIITEVLAPLDSIEPRPLRPVTPVSAPASVAPSQRFYSSQR